VGNTAFEDCAPRVFVLIWTILKRCIMYGVWVRRRGLCSAVGGKTAGGLVRPTDRDCGFGVSSSEDRAELKYLSVSSK
jgi:hypothetical protein